MMEMYQEEKLRCIQSNFFLVKCPVSSFIYQPNDVVNMTGNTLLQNLDLSTAMAGSNILGMKKSNNLFFFEKRI